MPFDLLIRGGTVVREDRVERADIAIEDEKIVEIAPDLTGAAREMIDATGLHVFPGVIDPHVHFNEPGRTEWEGFATGSSALAAGGGTLFFDMPLNSSPPVLDAASFDLKLEAARRSSFTDFAFWGGLSPGNLDKMEDLAGRGVVGFKAFMCDSGIEDFPHCDDDTLRRGMQEAARLGRIVAVHAESESITSKLTAAARKRGLQAVDDYLASRPVIAEVEAIGRAITLAQETGCDLHIVHVSSESGSRAAHAAEALGGFTYETCPHYLILDANDLRQIGAPAKCSPPLREQSDNKHLALVLSNREISFVASDHSPAPASMKEDANFFNVWGGIASVQSTLAIMLSLAPPLELETVSVMTATNAASRFEIRHKGAIAMGFDADLTLVNTSRTFELRREDLLDRHKLSPYVGRTFRGVIRRTILRGRTIFRDGAMVGPPAGRFVRPVT